MPGSRTHWLGQDLAEARRQLRETREAMGLNGCELMQALDQLGFDWWSAPAWEYPTDVDITDAWCTLRNFEADLVFDIEELEAELRAELRADHRQPATTGTPAPVPVVTRSVSRPRERRDGGGARRTSAGIQKDPDPGDSDDPDPPGDRRALTPARRRAA